MYASPSISSRAGRPAFQTVAILQWGKRPAFPIRCFRPKLNMGRASELAGRTPSQARGRLCRPVPAPDMPVPGLPLQGRIENAFRLPPSLAFRRGTPMRGNNATGARTGQDGRYTCPHRRSAHLLYDSEDKA